MIFVWYFVFRAIHLFLRVYSCNVGFAFSQSPIRVLLIDWDKHRQHIGLQRELCYCWSSFLVKWLWKSQLGEIMGKSNRPIAISLLPHRVGLGVGLYWYIARGLTLVVAQPFVSHVARAERPFLTQVQTYWLVGRRWRSQFEDVGSFINILLKFWEISANISETVQDRHLIHDLLFLPISTIESGVS